MNAGEGFEGLEVWKKGCRLSVDIYKAFSECRDFGFKDQIFRAGLSVPSNTAEGYERNSPREFVRFLNIAKGSIGELRTQLYIAGELANGGRCCVIPLLPTDHKRITNCLAQRGSTQGTKGTKKINPFGIDDSLREGWMKPWRVGWSR